MRLAAGLLLALSSLSSCTPSSSDIPTELLTTSADGTTIAYEVHGTAEPTLVLIHGWSNNRTWWDPHVASLSRTSRVVTLDLAGFGRSGASRDRYTMRRFGEDVAAVVRAADASPAVLVGYSMGGAVALEAERILRPFVSGVVLVDIFQDPTSTYSDSSRVTWRADVERTWHDFESSRQYYSPDAPDSLIQRYIDRTPSAVPEHWWSAIDAFFQWHNESLIPTLMELETPLEAINTERAPTDVVTYRTHVPGFRVATIPEVGHTGILWERVEEFDRLLLGARDRFMTDAR